RLRWYKRALDGLGPGQVLADSLLALDAALVQGRIGTVHRFPGGKSARVAAEGVVFSVEDR
ncbi:MAG: tRNA lysidine(34) synthetase TilS, partial [Desulfovibrionaceae bacterium]|nr:tRNA lysidine(34) synthetase TilS [Desulfovibrionaceae bacterium]